MAPFVNIARSSPVWPRFDVLQWYGRSSTSVRWLMPTLTATHNNGTEWCAKKHGPTPFLISFVLKCNDFVFVFDPKKDGYGKSVVDSSESSMTLRKTRSWRCSLLKSRPKIGGLLVKRKLMEADGPSSPRALFGLSAKLCQCENERYIENRVTYLSRSNVVLAPCRDFAR